MSQTHSKFTAIQTAKVFSFVVPDSMSKMDDSEPQNGNESSYKGMAAAAAAAAAGV